MQITSTSFNPFAYVSFENGDDPVALAAAFEDAISGQLSDSVGAQRQVLSQLLDTMARWNRANVVGRIDTLLQSGQNGRVSLGAGQAGLDFLREVQGFGVDLRADVRLPVSSVTYDSDGKEIDSAARHDATVAELAQLDTLPGVPGAEAGTVERTSSSGGVRTVWTVYEAEADVTATLDDLQQARLRAANYQDALEGDISRESDRLEALTRNLNLRVDEATSGTQELKRMEVARSEDQSKQQRVDLRGAQLRNDEVARATRNDTSRT